jgi:hypothetical protein
MRHHCQFKNCKCIKFIKRRNNLCYVCQHANIWHSKRPYSPPPTDSYLSFVSTRPAARTPTYERRNIKVNVFVPSVPPLPESDDEIIYCEAIEILPV